MRRRAAAALIALCVLAGAFAPAVTAAADVYFAGVNNRVLPLGDETMPRYFGGRLYLPYSVFASGELGVYCAASGELDLIMLYSSNSRRLTFDVTRATVFDQDRTQYFVSARASNGTVYLPAELVCTFFGLTLSVIQTDIAPVVRVKTASNSINDKTFVGLNKSLMRSYYDAYLQAQESPGATPPASSPPPAESVSPETPTYENVTIYMSFYSLSPKAFGAILDALDRTRFKCCFFAAAGEVAENADLIRRAAASGHTVGIWLDSGTYDEYIKASKLLFEAAKLRTPIVSAAGEAADAARRAAEENGLVFFKPTRLYDGNSKLTVSGLTGRLSVTDGSREGLFFACTEKAAKVMPAFFKHLAEHRYSVRKLTETTPPLA